MSETQVEHQTLPIIGHQAATAFFSRVLSHDQLSHAYLITGPQHIGKTTLATQFAQALLCGKNPACGMCIPCRQFIQGIHPDVSWVNREQSEATDALKKNISIEQIRQLQSRAYLSSFGGTYKVIIITEAHTLSLEAANALLKTLEEPTAKTVLLLLATHEKLLPATVVSRCQLIRLQPVADQHIYEQLMARGIERKKARQAAAASYGLPGRAITLATDIDVATALRQQVRDFITFVQQDLSGRFAFAASFTADVDREGVIAQLRLWKALLRDIALIQHGSMSYLAHQFASHELEQLAGRYQAAQLYALIERLQQAEADVAANVTPRLVLEHLALHF